MRYYQHELLTRSLLEEVASGSWRDGQKFLSVRDIRRLWSVSQPTVYASLRFLEEREILHAVSRSGYYLCREFQTKAQLLLHRNRTPRMHRQEDFSQKVRRMEAISGGDVAVLLETKGVAHAERFAKLPAELLSPSARRCARSFATQAQKHHFTPYYFLYNSKEESCEWIQRHLATTNYAGIAVFCRSGYAVIQPTLELSMKKRMPIVIMYGDCRGLPVHSININNVGIGYDAIRELYQKGHRNIAILIRKRPLKIHLNRLKGCFLAQTEGRCPDVRLTVLKFGIEQPLSNTVQRCFEGKTHRPTAIFATESFTLNRLLDFWEESGLKIPRDLSVIVCSSREQIGKETPIPINSMQLKLGAKIGRAAARQLHQIQKGEVFEKSVLLDAKYIQRGSVRNLTLEQTKSKAIS